LPIVSDISLKAEEIHQSHAQLHFYLQDRPVWWQLFHLW